MSDKAATKPKKDLVDRLYSLAVETGSTADEIEVAAREYAEYERWKEAKVQEALDEEARGAPTYDLDEVLDEMRAIIAERQRQRT